MIAETFLWCWDARPYPAFPTRAEIWADGPSWRRGHWLNGRAGLSSLPDVVRHICVRAGVEDVDVSRLVGALSGYVVDSPLDARAAIEPLMAAYDFAAAESEAAITFFLREGIEPLDVSLDALTEESRGEAFAQRGDGAETPIEARVRFVDAERDHLIGAVSARRLDRAEGGVAMLDAPLVLDAAAAERIAQTILTDKRAAIEALNIGLGPAHLALEPGDQLRLHGGQTFEIARIDDAETRRLELRRTRAALSAQTSDAEPSAPTGPSVAPTPALAILDLPPLPGAEADDRPLAAVFASPWRGPHEVFAG